MDIDRLFLLGAISNPPTHTLKHPLLLLSWQRNVILSHYVTVLILASENTHRKHSGTRIRNNVWCVTWKNNFSTEITPCHWDLRCSDHKKCHQFFLIETRFLNTVWNLKLVNPLGEAENCPCCRQAWRWGSLSTPIPCWFRCGFSFVLRLLFCTFIFLFLSFYL